MTQAWVIVLTLTLGACAPHSPTAPTPVPAAVNPPPAVVTTPPVVMPPAPNPLLSDPRFDLNFYRMFALGAFDFPGTTAPLKRQQRRPLFYVMTVDNTGTTIDARTLDATAAALINTAPIWNGGMGIEGLSMGKTPPPSPACQYCAPDPALLHHIAVVWDSTTTINLCARSDIGGNLITVFLRTRNCNCLGLAVAPVVIRHELGHTMGFWHTDKATDVMGASGTPACDLNPSAREQFHAKVAYSQPNGSFDPK